MLNRIANERPVFAERNCMQPSQHDHINLYDRDELEDIQTAIKLLFEFKEKLSKLHPFALETIEILLQRQRY